MLKRRYCLRRNPLPLVLFGVACTIYIITKKVYSNYNSKINQEMDLITRNIKTPLQDTLKYEQRGCKIPKLDPFSKELNQYYKVLPPVVCNGKDWVKCYQSECKIQSSMLIATTHIFCNFWDIIYDSDANYHFSPPTFVTGNGTYVLDKSDHVKIFCIGQDFKKWQASTWAGHAVGIRKSVQVKTPPEGREDTYNVMMVGFDSTSKNGFIRRMPKSYDFLVNDLKAVLMNGYNIVGDATPEAMFPLLTGRNEKENPDARRWVKNNKKITMDFAPFIFYTLKEDGYRTAYLEDNPNTGTFQHRFRGFAKQPTHHYMNAFLKEVEISRNKLSTNKFCIGDTPQYFIMLNFTKQFFEQKGKKFCFTFIADISHDDINTIATADNDLYRFLIDVKNSGVLENTVLIIMSDHGPRYAKYVSATLQGKFEHRLPFLTIKVPEAIQGALASNSHTLVTAYDLHATILDIVGLEKYMNDFKVPGSEMPRGLSLLKPIPLSRTCNDAGIDPHWCSCLHWTNVSHSERVYQRAGNELVNFINSLTEPQRSLCAPRHLTSITWLMRQRPNDQLMSFHRNSTGYMGKYEQDYYQIRITVGPGVGEYEATMAYNILDDTFMFNSREISRTNAYGDESKCISMIDSRLNMFCYCKK